MAPHAKVGAMEPVMLDRRTKQMKTAPEKIISAMRASMRGLAEKRRKRILKEHDQGRRKIQNITWVKNLPDIAAAMVDKSITLNKKEHGINLAKDKLLTLTNEEAKKVGFSYYTAENVKKLLEKMKFANYKIVEIRPKLKHVFISFLTNSWITMILLSIGMLGIIIEIKTPGWGIPGTFGVLSLALFFYANIVAGNASWEAPVLFIIGILLLGLEIFVIPGFGVVGISGILCIFASFYTGLGVQFHNFWQAKKVLSQASAIIFGSVAISIGLAIIVFKFLPKTRLFPKIVLMDAELGYKAHQDMSGLIGRKGITVSSLRPAGIALIEDRRLDVVSEGGFINKNSKIFVKDVQGSRIIVSMDE
jgi:membrane-bound serine protease (ClpP class)